MRGPQEVVRPWKTKQTTGQLTSIVYKQDKDTNTSTSTEQSISTLQAELQHLPSPADATLLPYLITSLLEPAAAVLI
jgi:hypothetical protein